MDNDLPNLGEQELHILRYVAAHGPVTAREVVAAVNQDKGLARTTILTVIERLRKKGYVTRRLSGGVFVYLPRVPNAELLQDLVKTFVEKSLGGAVSPVMAYLASVKEITPDDVDEMQRLVDQMKRTTEARKSDGSE